MLRMFYPHAYVDSVFDIDYEKLYQTGYRGILFDIDNTLVPHGADATEAVNALFRELHRIGFQTLLLSNNGEERVKRFLTDIDALYLCNAGKPRRRGYRRAVAMLHMPRNEIVSIGDQVFTDVLGANLSGIDNILVRFIGWQETKKLGKRRALEKLILECYQRNRSCQNRIGDVRKAEGQQRVEKTKKAIL